APAKRDGGCRATEWHFREGVCEESRIATPVLRITIAECPRPIRAPTLDGTRGTKRARMLGPTCHVARCESLPEVQGSILDGTYVAIVLADLSVVVVAPALDGITTGEQCASEIEASAYLDYFARQVQERVQGRVLVVGNGRAGIDSNQPAKAPASERGGGSGPEKAGVPCSRVARDRAHGKANVEFRGNCCLKVIIIFEPNSSPTICFVRNDGARAGVSQRELRDTARRNRSGAG